MQQDIQATSSRHSTIDSRQVQAGIAGSRSIAASRYCSRHHIGAAGELLASRDR